MAPKMSQKKVHIRLLLESPYCWRKALPLWFPQQPSGGTEHPYSLLLPHGSAGEEGPFCGEVGWRKPFCPLGKTESLKHCSTTCKPTSSVLDMGKLGTLYHPEDWTSPPSNGSYCHGFHSVWNLFQASLAVNRNCKDQDFPLCASGFWGLFFLFFSGASLLCLTYSN